MGRSSAKWAEEECKWGDQEKGCDSCGIEFHPTRHQETRATPVPGHPAPSARAPLPAPSLFPPTPCRRGVRPRPLGPAWLLSAPQPAPWPWEPKSLRHHSWPRDARPCAPALPQAPGSPAAQVSRTPDLERPARVGIAAAGRASNAASKGLAWSKGLEAAWPEGTPLQNSAPQKSCEEG